MSALAPFLGLVFLALMGWVLLRLIGGPGGPETFNPNSCSSCSSKQGGQGPSQPDEARNAARDGAPLKRFLVAPGHHRLGSPR